jgi:hypothetical protein
MAFFFFLKKSMLRKKKSFDFMFSLVANLLFRPGFKNKNKTLKKKKTTRKSVEKISRHETCDFALNVTKENGAPRRPWAAVVCV